MTSPIFVGGDDDAGGRDDVSATVAGSVAAATARYTELSGDSAGSGTTIGDLMNIPAVYDNTLPPASQPGLYGNAGDEPVTG